MLRTILILLASASILGLTSACTSNPLAIDVVAVDVSGDVVVSPTEPATFRVTAVNRTGERVVWGLGSSSCQLGLMVQVSVTERHSIDYRGCTDDLAEQGLDPGQSRTETFTWGGEIISGIATRVLPPGAYHVVALAGNRARSASLTVTVVVP